MLLYHSNIQNLAITIIRYFPNLIRSEEVYKIGRLGKSHGLNGEVTMQVDDDVFYRVDADYLILELDGILVPFFLEEYRFKTDDVALIKFEGIDTQERARELTGGSVFFPRRLAEEERQEDEGREMMDEGREMMDEGGSSTISYAQLVGYTVKNANDGNKPVGEIAYIDRQTINTMFELTDGTLLPAAEELITDINTATRTITMDLPEGLL